ncbi:uncharacterized protein LOC107607377 [Arachis ipaensis]|uniref:uncharacterized protein LOC107607377 n=1 Tax=Arachis ipaensis TaxID=130454 RepID=UPI000A2AFD18|nr:uncharacterized protein LOC107607377 [Arachis ipaensis]
MVTVLGGDLKESMVTVLRKDDLKRFMVTVLESDLEVSIITVLGAATPLPHPSPFTHAYALSLFTQHTRATFPLTHAEREEKNGGGRSCPAAVAVHGAVRSAAAVARQRRGREIGKREGQGEKEARDGEGGAACVATPRRRRCWGCFGVCRRHGQRREGVFREEKEVLPAPPFIPVISRACRRCVFKERVSLEELPSAISSLTHLTDIANLFSLQVWAGFGERSRDGNKFVVAERPVKQQVLSFQMVKWLKKKKFSSFEKKE